MDQRLKYCLVLLSTCSVVNVMFYTFNVTTVSRADVVRGVSGYNPKFDMTKVKVTPFFINYQTGLVPTVQSTASYKHPVRQLKNIDRVPETAAIIKGANRVFKFHINRHSACSQNASGTVIVVISKVDHFIERQAIRNTWASVATNFNATVFFLVGTSPTPSVQSQVENEAHLYDDIVQVDIPDSYNYLTYKSVAMLQWLNDYCYQASYFMKVDDDMYIHIENVIKSISAHAPYKNDRFFLCHVFKEAPPIRDVYSKWYTSFEEYSKMFFPTYCSGTAYLFSSRILNDLYQSAMKTRFLSMEDVFLTGIAAENLDIYHVHDGGFSFEKREPTGCSYKHAVSGHEVTANDMFVIFAQLFNNEIDCETNENLVIKKAEEYS